MNEVKPLNKQEIIRRAADQKGIIVHVDNDHDAHLRGRLHVFKRLGILYVEHAAGNHLRFKLKKDTYLL